MQYEELLVSIFEGDKEAVDGLIDAGLLQIQEDEDGQNGVVRIRGGSTMIEKAFENLVADKNFRKGMQSMILDSKYSDLSLKVKSAEDALRKLGAIDPSGLDRAGKQGLNLRKSQLGEKLGNLAKKMQENRDAKDAL